jgi:hypothetical protein
MLQAAHVFVLSRSPASVIMERPVFDLAVFLKK